MDYQAWHAQLANIISYAEHSFNTSFDPSQSRNVDLLQGVLPHFLLRISVQLIHLSQWIDKDPDSPDRGWLAPEVRNSYGSVAGAHTHRLSNSSYISLGRVPTAQDEER